jgi:sugar lactone lactonase YvrE
MEPIAGFVPSLKLFMWSRAVLVLILLACLFLPVHAQVSFTGTSATQNFGSQPIGSQGTTQSLSFSIQAGTTVGSIAVVTTGLANLDFANSESSTCVVQAYTAAATCVLNVTFTPMAAGLRRGAVLFFAKANNWGKPLNSIPIYGIGTGPQIAFRPTVVPAITPLPYTVALLQDPIATAVDAAGNLFILDALSSPTSYRMVKLAPGGATSAIDPSVIGEALYLPSCVAVDGAGNIFIGDFYGRVVEVPFGGALATAIQPVADGVPLSYPSGLAVDGAGDLFVGDFMNNRVLELPAGGGAAIAIDPTVNGIPLDDPHGLAVDAEGDLFIADLANDRIVEVPADSSAPTAISPAVDGLGLGNPVGVAVDAAGNLFIADNLNDRIVELPADGDAALAIDLAGSIYGAGEVYGVTVDDAGNLFVIQNVVSGGVRILEQVQSSKPVALNFPTGTYLGSTDVTDGPQTMPVVNIGNESLTLTGLNFPADFSQASGDLNACAVSTTLSPGQQCDLAIEFTPTNGGTLSESVTLIDNAFNSAAVQQSIPVSGTGESPTVLKTPVPGSTLSGSRVTFSWTTMPGATAYYLMIGTMGVGSNNLVNMGKRVVTSWTFNGMPINGRTVYLRLITAYNLIQVQADYTFTAAQLAQWSPPPNAPGFEQSSSGNPLPRSPVPPLAVANAHRPIAMASPPANDRRISFSAP